MSPAGSRPSFALSYALRPAGPFLCWFHFHSGAESTGENSSLYTDTQQIRCICHAIATVMVLSFQNSMISTGLAWEDMLYPLYQKYRMPSRGDQDLLNIIFISTQVGSLLRMWFMEEFATSAHRNTFQPGLCWRTLVCLCPLQGAFSSTTWSLTWAILTANTKVKC